MRVDELLTRAVELNASDIHLGVGHAPTLRVDGELVSEGVAALNEDIETWTRQLLSEQELEQLHEFGEVDLSYRDRSGMRYRVNAFLQQGYKTLAIRVIPSRIPTL